MTITKDEIGNNFNDLTSNEITKEEADELLNKLGDLNWWGQEESSQFTGIETFYGFSSESKDKFLKEGIPAKCYTFKLDIDHSNAANFLASLTDFLKSTLMNGRRNLPMSSSPR